MNKVYVVECSAGSYDSFHWWIGGMSLDKEEAHRMADELEAEVERIKSECPFRGDPYDDDTSPEQEAAYWEYYSRFSNEMEWGRAEVKEYELGKIIPTKNFGV